MKLAKPAALLWIATILGVSPALAKPFAIEVLDDQTGRGVPLVELTTTGNITFITDSAGLVAFDEPGLMDQKVHFSVKSHGYEFPKDGFGFRGVVLETKSGGSAQIKIKRLNIAERLYRVTGQGIYRDTLLLGREPPIKQPVLNGKVIGSDSVMNAIYRGKIYWFWGDTNRVAYPLGNYHTTGATSNLEPATNPRERKQLAGLLPSRGVNLEYFTGDDGFARPVCKMPGEGPTWIGGLAVVQDAGGRERMFCGYAKIQGSLSTYRRGIALWNDHKNEFEHVTDFAPDVPLYPDGHALRDEVNRHLYFANPVPLVRVQNSVEHYQTLAKYEAFTCLKPGSILDPTEIDRDERGRIRYAWKRGTPPVGPAGQAKLVSRGLLKPHEKLIQLRDVATGKEILAHSGSAIANGFLKSRYSLITVQSYGASSFLGEIWYAEADSPVGPWVYATKVVTHDKYSFYNPKLHDVFQFSDDVLGFLYFEGTYTHTFSGNPQATPRYDYNQIMYRLNLHDELLHLPRAVYDPSGTGHTARLGFGDFSAAERAEFDTIRFFAHDRPRAGLIGLALEDGALRKSEPEEKPYLFVLPPDSDNPGITVPLYEYLSSGSLPPIYDVRGELDIAGYQRCPEPVCRVWPSPYQVPQKTP